MKRWKIAALTFIVTAALCAAAILVIGGLNDRGKNGLTLWYIQGDCSQARLEKLKTQYNYSSLSGQRRLSLRAFETEEELAAAFEQEKPGLLLCSSVRAEALADRGLLSEVELAAENSQEEAEAGDCFFKLGSRLPLLMLNEALCAQAGTDTDFDTLEELAKSCKAYTQATGKAFFSAESYAALVDAAMCSLGEDFSGDLRKDGKNADFTYVYNLLADCGYDGALLALGDRSAAQVAEGGLACACVRSDRLDEYTAGGLAVCALPLPKGGEKIYPAELMGFAVTAAGDEAVAEASDFLSWLGDKGRAEALAMASALIPAAAPESSGGFYWEPLLTRLGGDCELCYELREPQREEFDSSFAQALDLLS